jgi:hypothetical protein
MIALNDSDPNPIPEDLLCHFLDSLGCRNQGFVVRLTEVCKWLDCPMERLVKLLKRSRRETPIAFKEGRDYIFKLSGAERTLTKPGRIGDEYLLTTDCFVNLCFLLRTPVAMAV